MTRRERAPHLEWEFMCRIGVALEDVIGKEVGIWHSPLMSLYTAFRGGGSGGGCRQGLFGVIILFMSMIGKRRQRDATSAWKSSRKGRCASLVAIAVVF